MHPISTTVKTLIASDPCYSVQQLLEDLNVDDYGVMLTRAKAAELMGVSVITIDRYVRRGVIKKYDTLIGPRFKKGELRDLLEGKLKHE